jgi:4-amino-4-deoxy-L-arabinose transferase-like glycosyltransferase
MVIIAASLPFIGYYYWGKSGLIGGVPAGIFYLIGNYQLAEYILTEALTAFSVFLFVVAFIVFERWTETMTAVILGISLGIALLVKGSLVFLPIFTCVFIFIRAIKGHDIAQWKLLLITAASIVVVILPWSIYASSNSGQFVILSMQGDTEILDGNNELCIIDGRWHPEWINDPNAFYNNDGIDNTRVIEKVLNFYWHKPSYLPQCLFQKLYRSFMPFPLLLIFLGLMLLDGLFRFLNGKMNSRLIRSLAGSSLFQVPTWIWIVTGNFLMIALIFYWDGTFAPSRLVAPMSFVFALLGCVSIVRFFSNIYVFLRLR